MVGSESAALATGQNSEDRKTHGYIKQPLFSILGFGLTKNCGLNSDNFYMIPFLSSG